MGIESLIAQFGQNAGSGISAGINRGIERRNQNRLAELAQQERQNVRDAQAAQEREKAEEEYTRAGVEAILSAAPDQREGVFNGFRQGAQQRGFSLDGVPEQWSDDHLPSLMGFAGVSAPKPGSKGSPTGRMVEAEALGLAPGSSEYQDYILQRGNYAAPTQLGNVSLKDFTADSAAKYLQTGNPADLVRYQAKKTVKIGDVSYTEQEDGTLTPDLDPEKVIELKRQQAAATAAGSAEGKKEVEANNPKALQIKQTALRLVDELLGRKDDGTVDQSKLEATRDLFGKWDSSWLGRATQFQGGTVDQQAALDQLRDILTAENLDIMSGVLSETDLKVISNIAGGGLVGRQGDERALDNLGRLRESLSREVGAPQQAAPPQNGSPQQQTGAPPAVNELGWPLKIDANGNRAYVNPQNPNDYREI